MKEDELEKLIFIVDDEPSILKLLTHWVKNLWKYKVEIFEIISFLTQAMSLIIVSHDISLAAQFCHRIILLDKGKIYKIGTPSEVITAENISTVYQCPVLVDKNPISNTPRITILSKKHKDKKESS